jgi:hypothetical protein
MFRVVAAQLTHRVGRGIALLLGIFVAVTSFTVLTGTSEVSRLEVVGRVEENFRSAYDLLVRPAGATTALEARRGLVRNNFLSGLTGGITLAQYEAIKDIPGIDIAAPIAVLGYQGQQVLTPLPLADHIDPAAPRQLLRIRSTLVTDRGLTRIPGELDYAYATTNDLTVRTGSDSNPQFYETTGTGAQVPVCFGPPEPSVAFDRSEPWVGCFGPGQPPEWTVGWPVSFVLAAVDPEQEARLAGLDDAVVEGRYLTADDQPHPGSGPALIGVPVLRSQDLQVDEQLDVVVERLPAEAAAEVVGAVDRTALRDRLARYAGDEVERRTVGVSEAEAEIEGDPPRLESRWSVGGVDNAETGEDRLRPRPVDVADDQWSQGGIVGDPGYVPWSAEDVAYRRPRLHDARVPVVDEETVTADLLEADIVGTFDPDLLPSWNELSALPMETYSPPGAVGWDDRSRELLDGDSLQPSSSPGSYLASPPLMLTTLSSLPALTDPDRFTHVDRARPISAIRVRVAGVAGPDAESRERVRLAAEAIIEQTGLNVDVTIGSSPRPMRVDLGEGRFGRPELSLREEWVQKGVAFAVLEALDRKSLVLFGLILIVTCLVMANAAAAAVRARRTELGVLACLGWSSRALYSAVIGELLAIGVVAGGLAGLAAPLVASLFDIDVPASRAWVPVAASLVVAVLAGSWPASRAARAEPSAAVRPQVLAVRSPTQPRGLVGLAATNVVRMPGRTLLGALSLAVGVGALTVVLAATFAFRNLLVASLLGQAISIQVRGVDYVAVGAVLALGAFAVGDVLYLNVRERAAEFATLQAAGWSGGDVSRLVLGEGLLVGLVGSLAGGVLGLVGALVFAQGVTAGLLLTTAAAMGIGTALAAVAAVVPARLPARLPIARLLAEE